MIFISYASEDYDFAARLYELLEAKSLDPWLDKKKLKPGQEWEPEIWKAANAADYFCLLLSPASLTKRGFIRKEMRFGLEKWKEKLPEDSYLIPCRIGNIRPPIELSHIQYTDLNSKDDLDHLVDFFENLSRSGPITPSDPKQKYETKSRKLENSNLSIDISFPSFSDEKLADLNTIVEQQVREFEEEASEFDTEPSENETTSFFESSFNLFFPFQHVVSILFLEPIRKEVESAESFMIPCKARYSSRSALPCGQPNTAVRRTVADFAIRVI